MCLWPQRDSPVSQRELGYFYKETSWVTLGAITFSFPSPDGLELAAQLQEPGVQSHHQSKPPAKGY